MNEMELLQIKYNNKESENKMLKDKLRAILKIAEKNKYYNIEALIGEMDD